jgi:hypothetical protein
MGIEKKIKDELRNVIKALSDLPCSRPFRDPVDGRRYPDYFLIVTQPMDLKTLRKNLLDSKYDSVEEFHDDVQRIFDNCKAYNIETSNPIRQQCDELERNFIYQWQNFVARRCVEQGLENVNKETAEVLSLVHSRKRKEPEPEIVSIPLPPPIKKPKVPKAESSLSFSFSISVPEELPTESHVPEPKASPEQYQSTSLKLRLPVDIEPLPLTEDFNSKTEKDTALILKLTEEDLLPNPPPAVEEELDLDKGRFSHVIKFTVPELVPEPVPVPVKVSLPAPPVPDSEEYIRSVLSPFLSPVQSTALRREVISVLHKYQYTIIPLDA